MEGGLPARQCPRRPTPAHSNPHARFVVPPPPPSGRGRGEAAVTRSRSNVMRILPWEGRGGGGRSRKTSPTCCLPDESVRSPHRGKGKKSPTVCLPLKNCSKMPKRKALQKVAPLSPPTLLWPRDEERPVDLYDWMGPPPLSAPHNSGCGDRRPITGLIPPRGERTTAVSRSGFRNQFTTTSCFSTSPLAPPLHFWGHSPPPDTHLVEAAEGVPS